MYVGKGNGGNGWQRVIAEILTVVDCFIWEDIRSCILNEDTHPHPAIRAVGVTHVHSLQR